MSTVLHNTLLPTYPVTRATFVEGDGVWLTDDMGRRYLDFAAGIAVVALGHKHPAPLAAAHRQLDRLWHVSNLYGTEPAPALAEALSARFGGAQAFFCNSGAEANEAAIKYARKATGKPGVLALEQSFHGRTTGALAVTGQPAKRAAFEPLMPGARFAKPNDMASLRAASGDDVGLVLLEPVLGEGGVIPLTPEFVKAAADLAEELGALLAFDEIQTGVGRTGTFFAFEQLGVRPQLVTLAKGLANGLPIGCLLVADEAAGAFAPATMARPSAATPSCVRPHLPSLRPSTTRCSSRCGRTAHDCSTAWRRCPESSRRAARACSSAPSSTGRRSRSSTRRSTPGLVCLTSGPNVLRLAPPLVVEPAEIDRALQTLTEVMNG